MRKWISKKLAGVLCLCMAGALLVGCGSGAKSNSETVLFKYDGQNVYLDEAWVYAKTIQSQYEAWYGSSVWDYEVNDENGEKATMEEVTKKDVISQIKMVKVLSKKAKEANLTLTDEEQEQIDTNVKSFMESISDADLKQTGVTEETLKKIYEENALATKYHEQVISEANITVEDSEARQYKTYNLLFETFKTDENGQEVQYSAKKKASQKKKAEEALARIKAGENTVKDLKAMAEEYKADKSSEYTFGDDGSTVQEYADAAMKLKKGEVSGIVESQFGYHIIKMINPNDKEATKEKKEELLQEKQNQYFSEQYSKMTEDLEAKWDFDKDVDQKAFAKITFKQTEESTTASEETTESSSSTTASENVSTEGEATTAE